MTLIILHQGNFHKIKVWLINRLMHSGHQLIFGRCCQSRTSLNGCFGSGHSGWRISRHSASVKQTDSHGYRPPEPRCQGGEVQAQAEAHDPVSKQLLHGREVPRLSADYHRLQPCPDRGLMWKLQHDAVPAYWWSGSTDGRMLLPKEGRLRGDDPICTLPFGSEARYRATVIFFDSTNHRIAVHHACHGTQTRQTLRGAAPQVEQKSTGSTILGAAGVASVAGLLGAMSLARPSSRSSVVRCAYDASKEIGACDPLLFWDPIGCSALGIWHYGNESDMLWKFFLKKDVEDFDRRRAVELKHGRICMFATIGMLWPDVFGKFDGYLSPSQDLMLGHSFPDRPVPLEGWLQVLLVAGLIETQLFKDPAERKLKLTTELNNGRLAMVAMTAMLIQNGLTGQSPVEQLTSGHISPFNDGQGFFAQFDPSKELMRSCGSEACATEMFVFFSLPMLALQPGFPKRLFLDCVDCHTPRKGVNLESKFIVILAEAV
eukprot:s134_g29.t1